MNIRLKSILASAVLVILTAGSANALTVEQDQPGFRSKSLNLSIAARAAAAWGELGSTRAAHFSAGTKSDNFKRKAFPPGFGRSGFEFADEVLSAPARPIDATPANNSVEQNTAK